uniref:Olfactory receptor n=1 Tax=Rhinopithecus bieti TaxID=61621 RepID=A0A2K6LB02_RHIBE
GRMNTNTSMVTEFLLVGFSHLADLQGLLFSVFLTIYLLTVAGNFLIVVLVSTNAALQSPMYFFLRVLSTLEMGYTSVTVPLLLHHLLTGECHISRSGCALHTFFFLFFGATECCLLAAMAYDRYAAICEPLRYPLLLSHRIGLRGLWVLVGWGHLFLFPLPFCGPMHSPHFFVRCACPALVLWGHLVTWPLCPFGLILGSYGRILVTIFWIPSAVGRRKAFSTCSSHLIVVSLFYGTAIFIYIRPKASYDPITDTLVSLFYAVVTPILNPIIYSLRNTEVKAALKRTMQKMVPMEI